MSSSNCAKSSSSARYTQGPIIKTMLKTACAMLAGTLAISGYNIVDTYFVGRLGKIPMAAMGFTFPVVMILGCVFFGMAAGIMTTTAQSLGGGNTKRQIMLMRDFGATAICCTPSYFNFMIEQAEADGIDMHKLPLRAGIFGAEPWSDEMRKRIEAASGIKAYNIYGLSEIIGPGVAIECEHQSGMHIFEDHFYPEIIDPDTCEVLPDGEVGELVLTTLSKYAMPMIRYRTRDLTRIISEKCPCGRTIRRIDRISSRSDDMFIIRGVNVFPSQIETALLSVEGTTANYNIVLYTENGLDNIEVNVEINPALFSDKISEMEKLHSKLTRAIENVIGLRVRLNIVAPNSIQRSEGKAKRVTDNRIKA